ncbi:MAG: STAS domain-containing protein [Rhodocyclaceae bacterium]|nr:STAS domain-containing protein [Rhodocyclaceae bacterium]
MTAKLMRREDRIEVIGEMTFATAAWLLQEGKRALEEGGRLIDLRGVQALDSSGLAVLFGWQRHAAATGKTIGVINPPANLMSLAEVYGVDPLLALAQAEEAARSETRREE